MNTERLMNITKARIDQAFQDKEVLKDRLEKNIVIGNLQITVNAQNFLKENNINDDLNVFVLNASSSPFLKLPYFLIERNTSSIFGFLCTLYIQ